MAFLKTVYKHAPYRMRQLMANVEAIRRKRIRHGGAYWTHYQSMDVRKMLQENRDDLKKDRLRDLLAYSERHIPYFRRVLPSAKKGEGYDFSQVPFMTKDTIRQEGENLVNPKPKYGYWKGWTSGTTGSSLLFYRDKATMHYEYALYDRLYDWAGGGKRGRIARLSNVAIKPPERKRPPYWYYVYPFHRLQCSIDHVDEKAAQDYLHAMKAYDTKVGTGYGFSWYLLAEAALANEHSSLQLKGIVTDSEGLSNEQRAIVEKVFGGTVYQTYGTSEVGLVAVQCREGHYHIVDRCMVEVLDEEGQVLPEGREGELAITDLLSFDAPYIRYRPGDRGILCKSGCACGWQSPYLEQLTGRVEDYLVTGLGRKVRRIGRLVKDVQGIKAMQIVQDEPGKMHVRLIPKENFKGEFIDKMRQNCKAFLGDMTITWECVEELERAPSGKVKYIIRRF